MKAEKGADNQQAEVQPWTWRATFPQAAVNLLKRLVVRARVQVFRNKHRPIFDAHKRRQHQFDNQRNDFHNAFYKRDALNKRCVCQSAFQFVSKLRHAVVHCGFKCKQRAAECQFVQFGNEFAFV